MEKESSISLGGTITAQEPSIFTGYKSCDVLPVLAGMSDSKNLDLYYCNRILYKDNMIDIHTTSGFTNALFFSALQSETSRPYSCALVILSK